MRTIAILCAMLLAISASAFARGGSSWHSSGSHYSSSSSHSSTHKTKPAKNKSGEHHSNKAEGVPRDKNGHIARSEHAKNEFKKSHPCPSTGKSSGSCPGYVIDHTTPLKRGGKDEPGNMQWQTTQAAKAKDKVE